MRYLLLTAIFAITSCTANENAQHIHSHVHTTYKLSFSRSYTWEQTDVNGTEELTLVVRSQEKLETSRPSQFLPTTVTSASTVVYLKNRGMVSISSVDSNGNTSQFQFKRDFSPEEFEVFKNREKGKRLPSISL